MLNSIITLPITLPVLLVCLITAIALGILTALVFSFRQHHTRSFTLTLALLPMAVCIVIMMVNGNIGAGIAVAGTFTLVRFRSIPGTAREISAIFVDMVIGFTLGMGYIGIAVIFFLLASVLTLVLTWINFGGTSQYEKQLKITIPEDFDYNELFDDVFVKYTVSAEMEQIHTTNMGTLFELSYRVVFPEKKIPKEFLDELRARNGNLNIMIKDFDQIETL
jgi:hypothetical protein